MLSSEKSLTLLKEQSLTIPSNWAKDSACQNTDVDFYSTKTEEKRKAKAICAECPVRQMCIQTALDNKERFGIWGGADEVELRKNQAIDARGDAHVSRRGKIRCSSCGPLSSMYLEVIERKRTQTHLRCTTCGLKWWTRKLVNRKMSNL